MITAGQLERGKIYLNTVTGKQEKVAVVDSMALKVTSMVLGEEDVTTITRDAKKVLEIYQEIN